MYKCRMVCVAPQDLFSLASFLIAFLGDDMLLQAHVEEHLEAGHGVLKSILPSKEQGGKLSPVASSSSRKRSHPTEDAASQAKRRVSVKRHIAFEWAVHQYMLVWLQRAILVSSQQSLCCRADQ